jgi:predicted nuclease of predicted toxin-antitoxin system
MKLLIDMNLSPDWVASLREAGFESVHWSRVGDPRASDKTIMAYAKARGYVVFTHDLDFGAILAATRAEAPSIVQVRTQDIDPSSLAKTVVSLLHECREHLERGALISLDESAQRIRILPIVGRDDRAGTP